MNTLLQLAQGTYEYTTYTTTTRSDLDPATAGAIAAGALFFYFLILIGAYVVSSIFLGKIFKKANVPSWIAWVPFYNTWKMLEIGGQPGFWSVLAILPFVNIVSAVFVYIASYNIGLKLGKTGAFVLLAIFLPVVWLIWLAVDKSVWNEALGAPSKAVEHSGVTPSTPTVPPAPAV